jgi:hypothetical protein
MIVGVDHLLMTLSVITILLLCISISGLGTGMGAIYPQFRYDNIASISMGPSGMLFMIIAFSIVLLTLFAEAWSFYLYKKALVSGLPLRLWEKAQLAMSVLFILLLNSLAFYLPMKLGEKRLSGDLTV